MANARSGNQWFVDAGSAALTTTLTKLKQLILTPNAANDAIVLLDGSGGTEKLTFKTATNETTELKFDPPIVFPKGIYVSSITTNAKAYLTIEGGD